MALIANVCGARYCTVGTVNGRECSRLHGVDLTVNADIGSARRHVRSQERSGRPEGTAESVRATGRACSAVAPLGPTWRIGLAWYARAGRSRSARANRGQGVCAADYQAPVLGRDSECPRDCWFGLPGSWMPAYVQYCCSGVCVGLGGAFADVFSASRFSGRVAPADSHSLYIGAAYSVSGIKTFCMSGASSVLEASRVALAVPGGRAPSPVHIARERFEIDRTSYPHFHRYMP